jgi:hypothetical protein
MNACLLEQKVTLGGFGMLGILLPVHANITN